jgi:transcriptional regulator with XRE-family HTH domain
MDTGTFGARLQGLRVQRKESQEALARAVDVTSSSVSRWERDLALPNSKELVAIAKHYRVSLDHLLLGQIPAIAAQPDLVDFANFMGTHYGRVARERGYLDALAKLAYPYRPSLELYKALVSAFELHDHRTDEPPKKTDESGSSVHKARKPSRR